MKYVHLVNPETDEKYVVDSLDYQDIVLLLSSINQQTITDKTKYINWQKIQQLTGIPLLKCKRVWRYLQKQIYGRQEIFKPEMTELHPDSNEPSQIIPEEGFQWMQLNQLQVSQLQVYNQAKPGHSGLQKQTRLSSAQGGVQYQFSESEDQLLLYALYFHGPEYEYIAKRYLNNRPTLQVRNYYLSMKKRAMEKVGQQPHQGRMDRTTFKREMQQLFDLKADLCITEKLLLGMRDQIYGAEEK